MVKQISKIYSVFLIGILCFLAGCNNDYIGLVTAKDLDDRLAVRNEFVLLKDDDLDIDFDDDYSFIVLTDTHIENGDDWGLSGIVNIADNIDAKFVVVLGDITQYGSVQDMQKFLDFTEALSVPCYPVAGNHDVYFDSWPVWKSMIGSTSYKVKITNNDSGAETTLFILDSANAFFGRSQLDWLEYELKQLPANERIFVFTHAPLFVTGPVNMQQITDVKERARVVSLLRGRNAMMFMGHLHKDMLNEAGGVKYVAIEDFKSKKAYCVVTVNGANISFERKKL